MACLKNTLNLDLRSSRILMTVGRGFLFLMHFKWMKPEFFSFPFIRGIFIMDRKPTYDELENKVIELEKEVYEYRKIVESQRQQEFTAQSYLDIARVIILAINARGEITLINKKGCEILEYGENELIGRNWFETCLPEERRKDIIDVFRKLLDGEIENIEYFQNSVLTKNGDERIIDWYNTLLRDESGKAVGTLSSGEDVTEKVLAQKELQAAHEELANFSKELEKMVQEKTEELNKKNIQLIEAERLAALGKISNSVAHDLRNPLTVVGGFVRRLHENTPDDDANKKYLRIILAEVRVLESKLSEIIKIRNVKDKITNHHAP